VLLWGGRGLVPFAADKGQGFTHPILDLSGTSAILAAFFCSSYLTNP